MTDDDYLGEGLLENVPSSTAPSGFDDDRNPLENVPNLDDLYKGIFGEGVESWEMSIDDLKEFVDHSDVTNAIRYRINGLDAMWAFIGACRRAFAEAAEAHKHLDIVVAPGTVYLSWVELAEDDGYTNHWLVVGTAVDDYELGKRELLEALELVPGECAQYYSERFWEGLYELVATETSFTVRYNFA